MSIYEVKFDVSASLDCITVKIRSRCGNTKIMWKQNKAGVGALDLQVKVA